MASGMWDDHGLLQDVLEKGSDLEGIELDHSLSAFGGGEYSLMPGEYAARVMVDRRSCWPLRLLAHPRRAPLEVFAECRKIMGR